MQLREIAAIAGRPGLYRILKPTQSGVIVEALDGTGGREAVGASQRLSILSEISMYTTEGEGDGSEPLGTIMERIYIQNNKQKLSLSPKSDGADLEAFFSSALPNWDRDRVYLSDIKKLVTWYNILVDRAPDVLMAPKEDGSKADGSIEDGSKADASTADGPKAEKHTNEGKKAVPKKEADVPIAAPKKGIEEAAAVAHKAVAAEKPEAPAPKNENITAEPDAPAASSAANNKKEA